MGRSGSMGGLEGSLGLKTQSISFASGRMAGLVHWYIRFFHAAMNSRWFIRWTTYYWNTQTVVNI
eukprot:5444188-Karenia_brevis.AAC.1